MTTTAASYHYLECTPEYAFHDQRRSVFQDFYAEKLAAEPGIQGHVLDIGCGHGINPTLAKISHLIGTLDGIDPFPVVDPPRLLRQRWTCRLEEIPVSADTFDLAYSYNVIEHVSNEVTFLSKAIELLKPGGVYWSMSPNAWHPFSIAVRFLQATKLKDLYRRRLAPQSNDYPAFYRLCSSRRVLRAIQAAAIPASRIDFYYLPNVQWDTFFPPFFRLIPRLLDKAIVLRVRSSANVFMFRIEKAR
jgi:2-polyprenyl-3-methyl-5-hydroxy-6-metoxy-1,4-benzoquinol methylase